MAKREENYTLTVEYRTTTSGANLFSMSLWPTSHPRRKRMVVVYAHTIEKIF